MGTTWIEDALADAFKTRVGHLFSVFVDNVVVDGSDAAAASESFRADFRQLMGCFEAASKVVQEETGGGPGI